MGFVICQRVFWFRHDFARSVHVTRTVSAGLLFLSGPSGGRGGGLGKEKFRAFVARASTKCSLHLLAEWHSGGGVGEWSVVGAAKAERSVNERMTCLQLVGKRKMVGSISKNKQNVKKESGKNVKGW